MSDLSDLYQEVILDHSRHPHNFGPLPAATQEAKGYNPLCGDQVTVHLKMDGDVIEDIRFEGNGCAISKSSASVMTDTVIGKHKPEVYALFEKFHRMITVGAGPRARPQSQSNENPIDGQAQGPAPTIDLDDKLSVFSGVSEFPTRVKCAVLAWHTLKSALEGEKKNVSTEGINP